MFGGGDDEIFDPCDWALYLLSRTAREKQGYCVPREPIHRNARRKPMTFQEIIDRVEKNLDYDEEIYEEIVEQSGHPMNPRILLRRTKDQKRAVASDRSDEATDKSMSEQRRSSEFCARRQGPPIHLSGESFDCVWKQNKVPFMEKLSGLDQEDLDIMYTLHFGRCSVHYQATHRLSALPDRCSDYWRHHESCMWHLKCSFAIQPPASPQDTFPPVEPGIFKQFFKSSRDRFYWAFWALKHSPATSRWRLSMDKKCNDLRFLRCITTDKACFDFAKLLYELRRFQNKKEEEGSKNLELVKEIWRCRILQQFAIIWRIQPHYFDATERILVQELRRSLDILFRGSVKAHYKTVARKEVPNNNASNPEWPDSQRTSRDDPNVVSSFNVCRGDRGNLNVAFELERCEQEPEIPEKTRNSFRSLVYWMQTGLSIAERNLQLSNLINTNNMVGLKGIKKESSSGRMSSNEIISKCLAMIHEEIPTTVIAAIYALSYQTHQGMRTHVMTKDVTNLLSFSDDSPQFQRFQKIIETRELEISLLQNIKILILMTDQKKFDQVFRRCSSDSCPMDWTDEIKRLQVMECLMYFIAKTAIYRPVPYALKTMSMNLMVEYCEQGYIERENGFTIKPFFNAKAHQYWPAIWTQHLQKNYLPVAQYLKRMDRIAHIFEDALTKLITEVTTNRSEIIGELKQLYKKKIYPMFIDSSSKFAEELLEEPSNITDYNKS